MGIINATMNMLPTINVMGSAIPKWMELAGAGVIILLLVLSMLPKLNQANGRLGRMAGDSGNEGAHGSNDYGASW